MPIYEYRCTSCGESASELEKIGAARVKKCPSCGRRTFSRLVSAAAFHLKGGGWYETDFKNKGKPAPAAKESGKGESDNKNAAKESNNKESGDKKSKAPPKKESAKAAKSEPAK